MPLLSIIIPTFNSAKTIRACLASIATQDYPNMEIVVVDGGSTDGTMEIVNEFNEKFKNASFISEPDDGIYDALNKGVRRSRGEWLYFIGSDDELYNHETISKVAANFSVGNDYLYGKILHMERGAVEGEELNKQTIITKSIYHQATFYSRKLMLKIGEYNTKYKICADYDYSLRCFGANTNTCYMDLVVAKYSGTGISSTAVDYEFESDKFKNISNYYGVGYLNKIFRSQRFHFRRRGVYHLKNKDLARFLLPYSIYVYHSVIKKISPSCQHD
jgi:glycosyltransferase involved in cell wall biosynthesis